MVTAERMFALTPLQGLQKVLPRHCSGGLSAGPPGTRSFGKTACVLASQGRLPHTAQPGPRRAARHCVNPTARGKCSPSAWQGSGSQPHRTGIHPKSLRGPRDRFPVPMRASRKTLEHGGPFRGERYSGCRERPHKRDHSSACKPPRARGARGGVALCIRRGSPMKESTTHRDTCWVRCPPCLSAAEEVLNPDLWTQVEPLTRFK